MHRSSESIGTIAAALAQAQGELSNPEKSLVATIPPSSGRDSRRTFRYAPLSSGLDLVRKCLGKHEIATVQTTSLDCESGLVRLTTVLAHSSGQWISSEWPVCAISETSSPQRMGAALTYARRYALFTLVGIAGEDDLDAPDVSIRASAERRDAAVESGLLHPGSANTSTPPASRSNGKPLTGPAKIVLEPSASARTRDQLLAELHVLASAEDAVNWARGSLPAKNTLRNEDAKIIEAAFEAKMGAFANEHVAPSKSFTTENNERPILTTADSVPELVVAHEPAAPPTCRPLTKPRRIRDKAHRQHVSAQACLVCGRHPADAHHLRFAQPRAMGRRSSDEFTVPLCRIHHRELHQAGDELAWWGRFGVNPVEVAERLWAQTLAARQA